MSRPGDVRDNEALLARDGSRAMTGDLALGTHKITGGVAGTASTDFTIKSQLDAVAAATSGKYGFQFTFGTGTTNVDPTSGKLTFDSATPSAVARINIDLIDADGNDLTNWLAALDDAIGTIKGFVYWRSLSDDTKWGMYRLDSITSPGGYVSLNVTHIVSGTGGLPATTAGEVTLEFDAWGNGAAAGNGLTGTSTHAVLPDGGTLAVSSSGVKVASGGISATELANNAVATAKILDDNVTYPKIQNVSAASRALGRGSAAGAGDVEELAFTNGTRVSGTIVEVLPDGSSLTVSASGVKVTGSSTSDRTFTVTGGETITNAATQISLGIIDIAALPDGVAPADISAADWTMRITTTVHCIANGGDHGARMWKKETLAKRNKAGGGFGVTPTPANGNSNAEGLIGSANAATFAFDTSGTQVRFRVTPADTESLKWFAVHRCELHVFP